MSTKDTKSATFRLTQEQMDFLDQVGDVIRSRPGNRSAALRFVFQVAQGTLSRAGIVGDYPSESAWESLMPEHQAKHPRAG